MKQSKGNRATNAREQYLAQYRAGKLTGRLGRHGGVYTDQGGVIHVMGYRGFNPRKYITTAKLESNFIDLMNFDKQLQRTRKQAHRGTQKSGKRIGEYGINDYYEQLCKVDVPTSGTYKPVILG